MSSVTQAPTEEWVEVTPALAEEWLKWNKDNRRLVQARVIRFAEDMEADRWAQYHPHGIAFDQHGKLIDGQHRLEAVVLSGATVTMRVTRDLHPGMHAVFDLGAPRSASDILTRGGIQNSAHASTIVSMLYLYDNYPDTIWSNPRYPSKTWQLEYVSKNYVAVQDAVKAAASAFRAVRIPRAQYGVLYLLVERHALLNEWDEWHEKIVSGAGLTKGDPRLTLRNYFGNTDRLREGTGSWQRQRRLGLILKAFRMYREGKSVSLLRFDKNSLPMPMVVDGKFAIWR